VQAPPHPIDALRAARRDLLAALQGCTAADLLRPGVHGDWCGRDVLLRIAAWLHELAHVVPDLATYGYQRGERCDPGPDGSAWNAAHIARQRTVRPEGAVARVVTAHARLLVAVAGLDDAGLRRRGPTRFGFVTSGWELLVAVADDEGAARLLVHGHRKGLRPHGNRAQHDATAGVEHAHAVAARVCHEHTRAALVYRDGTWTHSHRDGVQDSARAGIERTHGPPSGHWAAHRHRRCHR
jgi:hypothetical protein